MVASVPLDPSPLVSAISYGFVYLPPSSYMLSASTKLSADNSLLAIAVVFPAGDSDFQMSIFTLDTRSFKFGDFLMGFEDLFCQLIFITPAPSVLFFTGH